MLIKLTKRGTKDISDLKLYWDTEKKQVRHKAKCGYCNAEIRCMCYDYMREAYEGIELCFLCDACWIKENLDRSLTLEDIVNNLSEETASKVLKYILENLTKKDSKQISVYISNLPEYTDVDEFYGRPCKI